MAALPYIQLYVADYLADTAHLNAAQHGAYLLLLMNYWQRGKALNNANERLANVARMSSEEWAANKADIAEFFDIDGDEWHHARIERDLATVAEKSEKAKAAGRASASVRSTSVNNLHNERSTSAQQPLSHKDTDTDTDTEEIHLGAEAPLVCPVEKIIDAYHEAMPTNPRCRVLNSSRKRSIRQRWLEASRMNVGPFGYETQSAGVDAWRRFFEVCAQSDFLTGKVPGRSGAPPFVADVDFLFSPSGFAKCLENKYHREQA